FKTGSAAVTTPVNDTLSKREACSADKEMTSWAFVKCPPDTCANTTGLTMTSMEKKNHWRAGASFKPARSGKRAATLCLLTTLQLQIFIPLKSRFFFRHKRIVRID